MPEMTISVSQEKYSKFKTGYLKLYPVPTDKEGNPTMSEAQWIREKIRYIVQRDYARGHRMLQQEAQEAAEEGIVT